MSLLTLDAASHEIENVAIRLRFADRGPYLIYDLTAIRRACEAIIRIGKEENIHFIASAKSLPSDQLLGEVNQLDGFDVSNEKELRRIGDWKNSVGSGVLSYIAVTGPVLSCNSHGSEIVADRMTVNVENESQISSFERLASWAHTTELGLRVGRTPGSGMLGSVVPMSRFGWPQTDIEAISRLARHPRFAGFHCHVGGDHLHSDSHVTAMECLLRLAADIEVSPRVYNLGGGFRRETTEDIRVVCRRLRRLAPPEVEIILEPGAWFTAAAGYALGKVISAHHRRDLGATVIVVDLSRDCHLRWSELELLRWWGDPPNTRKILIFGPTCHEGDCLGAFEWSGTLGDRPPGPGAWMLFGGVTGYAAAWNCGFNGIDPARVVGFGNV